MRRKAAKRTTSEPCTDPEGHLFMLPPPNGRVCVGTCARCGKTREHANSYVTSSWVDLSKQHRELKALDGQS